MKVKELIEKLNQLDPEAEVWVATINDKGISTYGLLDHIMQDEFGMYWVDLMPTPGLIDERLIKDKKDEDNIVYLGTTFNPPYKNNDED